MKIKSENKIEESGEKLEKIKISGDNRQNLADFLREKRQSKNFSLEKLSELTKIQTYHLEALEAGHFEKLPPSVYRDGIFKRLLKFLDINEKDIAITHKNELESKTSATLPGPLNLDSNFSFFILTPGKIAFYLGGLLLVFVSAYLWYQFNFLIGPPNLAIEPKEDMVTVEKTLLLSGKTDSGVDLTINGESAYIASNGSFSKEIQLATGVNIIEVEATNNFGKVSKIIRKILRAQ